MQERRSALMEDGKKVLAHSPERYQREINAIVAAGDAESDALTLFNTIDDLDRIGGCSSITVVGERSLPGGGMVDFTNLTLGWTLAGPLEDELYQTQDGGWTWQRAGSTAQAPLHLRNPQQNSLPAAEEVFYVNDTIAWAFTRAGECNSQGCTSTSILWRTLDGGTHWNQVELPGSN